ncbi:MAG: potassium/proton antiporter [Cyclobacteriaceae bacterium]|nr:potassium/proton antiporter [Cyclobacteriaceae bacterium]
MPEYQLILIISLSIAAGVIIHNYTRRFGIPAFLIFLAIGLLFGDGHWGEPVYDNPKFTSLLSQVALSIIIFTGGFNSPLNQIRLVWKEGIMLSTAGVLLTTFILGTFTHLLTEFPFSISLLFGAMVSSTDAAAVFNILESGKLKLRHNTDTVLEFEAATNDPMALILISVLIEVIQQNHSEINLFNTALRFISTLGLGTITGLCIGWITRKILMTIDFKEAALVPLFMLSSFLTTIYTGLLTGGNILVAVYFYGLITGNTRFSAYNYTRNVIESTSWMAQAFMFLLLGLQIFIDRLADGFLLSIVPGLFLIFFARPAAVFICYLPFRKENLQKKIFISAVGLKGATPIVFAFMPLLAGIPYAEQLFDMVFFIVLLSIFIQGSLIELLARKLNLTN